MGSRGGFPSTLYATLSQDSVDPGANTDVALTVPPGKGWEIDVVTFSIVQGNTDTPRPILIIDAGADDQIIGASIAATAAQSANTTCQYTFGHGMQVSAVVGSGTDCYACAPLPVGFLQPGWRIRTKTVAKGSNTNLSPVRVIGVEYG